MSARTQTRSIAPARGGVEARLPWWAVLLPAIAFAVLLLLIVGPGEAHAAGGEPGVAELLERIQQTLAK
ncbi:hypothetical protein [Streptomyces sp. SYSU K217416]